MRPFIAGDFDGLQLCARRELFRLDGAAVRTTLREALAAGAAGGIRAMLRNEFSSLAADRLSDEELIEQIAARVESGEMVALTRRANTAAWTQRTTVSPPTPVEPVLRAPRETTWVEVSLVDEDGDPVPDERYEILTPDGVVHRGRLDYRGRVRLSGITVDGACQVKFPDLDADAWERM